MNKYTRSVIASYITHVDKFMNKYGLYPRSGLVYVAFSGGEDSVVLGQLMLKLKEIGKIKQVKFIHVNHKVRPGNESEERFVRELAREWEVELIVKSLNWKEGDKSNFESEARKKRYEIFHSIVKQDDSLVLGHHLDDSFEWALMQKLRSSNSKSSLGIPVKRGYVKRPLLCLSKKHLKRFTKLLRLRFVQDPTNEETHFERNYLRKKVIPHLEKRFPKYLKHYVHQSNELARVLGLNADKRESFIKVIEKENESFLIDMSLKNHFSTAASSILKQIYRLGKVSRGTYHEQVQKIIQGAQNSKNGPFNLSGGLSCYLSSNVIYLSNQKNFNSQEVGQEFEKINFSDFKGKLIEKINQGELRFPFYVGVRSSSKTFAKSKFHPDFGIDSSLTKGNEVIWPALELLRIWQKNQVLYHKTLVLSTL